MSTLPQPDPANEFTPPAARENADFKKRLLKGPSRTAPAAFTPAGENEDVGIQDNNANPSHSYLTPAPPPVTFDSYMDAITAYLEKTDEKEQITILGDFGKLVFQAVHVAINQNGVAMILKKDAMQFEPKINADLDIVYRDRTIPVVYAGGFFTFSKIAFTFISFVRINPEEQEDD